jgi:hypothetical protein
MQPKFARVHSFAALQSSVSPSRERSGWTPLRVISQAPAPLYEQGGRNRRPFSNGHARTRYDRHVRRLVTLLQKRDGGT